MEVDALCTCYRTRQRERIHAVDGVSFRLRAGEVLGIAGESGCGKSTLAASLMGLYSPPLHYLSGGIRIQGEEITGLPREELRARVLGKKIAYIPQAAMNVLNPTRRIFPFIRDILEENGLFTDDAAARELAARRFADLNLPVRALDAYPNELSGGMKQRVVIAVSTILDPSILVADEPTSALDVTTQKVVIRMLRDLMRRGIVKSMVFITHELPILRHIADRILVMYAGRIVESGPMSRLIFDPQHPYARALMSSIIVPEKGMKARALACLEGEPPSLKERLPGCAFAERCALSTDACRAAETPVREVEDGMYRCAFDRTTLREMYQRGGK